MSFSEYMNFNHKIKKTSKLSSNIEFTQGYFKVLQLHTENNSKSLSYLWQISEKNLDKKLLSKLFLDSQI